MDLSYVAICFDLFGTLVDDQGRAFDGAQEALAAVPADACAIVTSCGGEFARSLLRANALPEPRILVSSDDVARTKPAPDCYALAATMLGAKAGTILAIEDSRQGIASACAAGLNVIAILNGRPFSYANEALYAVERLVDLRWSRSPQGGIVVTF